MNREDFVAFVAKTLEDVVQFAEETCAKPLPRKLAFQWMGRSQPVIHDNVVETIVQRVYIDEEHIYPCVDIGVGDILEDGTLLIVANVAGYAPRPFGQNWTGRDGPFVRIVGQPLLEKMVGRKSRWSAVKRAFDFIRPDIKDTPKRQG